MTSFDAGILWSAVVAAAPRHAEAHALVERFAGSRDVVVSEQTLIALYARLAAEGAGSAARVIDWIRRNPAWRLVDVQSDRVQMNAVWEAVLAHGEDVATIARRRLVQTLRRNGVTTFFTEEAAAFRQLGFDAAVDPYAE